jgi:hypothetical protein
MVFNDTTTLTGIIQRMEEYTGLGDAGISGDTIKLKQATAKVNESFDELMPLVLAADTDTVQWDDENRTDQPIATFNLVANQNDYKVSTDANSLEILDIKKVMILPSATATIYAELPWATADEYDAALIMSPNTGVTGVPSRVLKRGNTLFFDLLPSYSATNGVKIFFERIESYFASTDTTKVPGIPRIFHPLLAKIAAYKWLIINKTSDTVLIGELKQQIAIDKAQLHSFIKQRSPSHKAMTMEGISFR